MNSISPRRCAALAALVAMVLGVGSAGALEIRRVPFGSRGRHAATAGQSANASARRPAATATPAGGLGMPMPGTPSGMKPSFQVPQLNLSAQPARPFPAGGLRPNGVVPVGPGRLNLPVPILTRPQPMPARPPIARPVVPRR